MTNEFRTAASACMGKKTSARIYLLILSVRGGPWRTAKTPALGRGYTTEVATSPTANMFGGPPAACRFSLILRNPSSSVDHSHTSVKQEVGGGGGAGCSWSAVLQQRMGQG